MLLGGVDGCCCAPLGSCYQFSSDQLCPFGMVGCLAPFATGFCQDHLPGTLCLRILSGLNPVFLGPVVPLWVPLLITHRVSKLLSLITHFVIKLPLRITHGEIKLPSLITHCVIKLPLLITHCVIKLTNTTHQHHEERRVGKQYAWRLATLPRCLLVADRTCAKLSI